MIAVVVMFPNTSIKPEITLEDPSKEKQEIATDTPEAERIEPEHKVSVQATAFSGPLPPPSILREYDSVVSGGAERIFVMAEKEQAHTHKCEKSEMELQRIGAIGLMVLVLVIVLIGGALIYSGKSGSGFTLVLGALAPLFASGFLRSKVTPKSDD